MTRGQAVLATLVLYKIVLVAIGLLAQRRTKDSVDFYLGGRGLGPTVAAVSASASSSSAWTLLGVSGAAYLWGLSAIWLFPGCVGGFLLNWYVLARPLRELSRRTGAVTTTDVLAGPRAPGAAFLVRAVASGIILFSLLFYVASQFQGAGKTFAETFGLGMTESILIGSAVVVFYTILGGFWAVSLTDTVQGLVMAVTAVILPVAALARAGGPAGVLAGMETVPADGYLSLIRHLGPAAGTGFVLGLLGIGLGYPGQPHVVNRFMALREGEGALRAARRIAIAWAVAVYAGMLILGWSGRVLFPEIGDHEVVFLTATNGLFPPVLAGVMVAAVLSAIMSTADSQLLVAGSAVTHDLGLGGGTPAVILRRSRLVVLALSIGAIGTALAGTQEIFAKVLFAWSAMGAAFGPALLVTALRGPLRPQRVLASMGIGFAVSVGAYWAALGPPGLLERVVAFALALAVVLPRGAARPRLDPAAAGPNGRPA